MATLGTVIPEGGEVPKGRWRAQAGRPSLKSTLAEGRGFLPAEGKFP